jgi:enamine deaminase RidA (YjgF/YER057c/UK114 family)
MPSDILYVNLHVTDMSLFGQINKIYCKYFHYNPPSRACVEVTSNLQNGAKCMADCMGYVNSGQCIGDRRVQVVRDVLHVQSISEWAPTCIGPYSQANMLSGIHYQAGQIGLDPASMTLVPGGWENETTQTLQNIHAVLKCCKSSIANILSCVVWINTSTNVNTLGVKEVIKKWLNKNVPTQNHFIGEEKISFIPVPNLPRGAAVELQIIAMENHIFSQSNPLLMMQKWQNMQLVEEEEKTKEDKEIQRSFIDFHGVYVNGLVCVGHSRFYFSNIDSIHEISANLKNVLNSFNDIIEKQSNMTWSVVNQLQIYYCGNASIHARIRSLFEECWNSTIVDRKGMLPALSFVPVDKQNENERENTTTTNEDRNNSTSSNEESEEDVSAIFGDGDDVRFGESGSNSSSEPTKAPPTDNMFIQIFIKAFNIEALSHLVKQNIDSTQAVSKSHSNLSKEIEKEDDDEEQLDMNDDFVSLNGGFTAAMKAVEEADQADELASECSDMSDTDANIFDGMPMSGAIGSDSESDDDIGTN